MRVIETIGGVVAAVLDVVFLGDLAGRWSS